MDAGRNITFRAPVVMKPTYKVDFDTPTPTFTLQFDKLLGEGAEGKVFTATAPDMPALPGAFVAKWITPKTTSTAVNASWLNSLIRSIFASTKISY